MDDTRSRSQLDWYATHAPMSELGEHTALAHSDSPDELVARIQQLLIHPFHAYRYGVHPDAEAERQLQARSARQILADLLAIDASPVHQPVNRTRVILFRKNLEKVCSDRDDLVEQIQVTVRHEIGHHLGLSEEDMERLGLA